MKFSVKKFAQALYLASLDKDKKELDQVIDNFFKLLRQSKQLTKAPQILVALDEVRREAENKILVTVSSRNHLSKAQLQTISKYCQKMFNQEPEIEEVIDENIIGGVKLKYGDTELDATVNQKLKILQNHLSRH